MFNSGDALTLLHGAGLSRRGNDIAKDLVDLLERLASGLGVGKGKDERADEVRADEQDLFWSASVLRII